MPLDPVSIMILHKLLSSISYACLKFMSLPMKLLPKSDYIDLVSLHHAISLLSARVNKSVPKKNIPFIYSPVWHASK